MKLRKILGFPRFLIVQGRAAAGQGTGALENKCCQSDPNLIRCFPIVTLHLLCNCQSDPNLIEAERKQGNKMDLMRLKNE